MRLIYLVMLILLIVFTIGGFFAIQWDLGVFAEDNQKFWISISAGIIGIILTLIMNSLSRIETSSEA